MRTLAILFLFGTQLLGDWKADVRWYYFSGVIPGVAVTSSNVISCEHSSGSFTAVQVGDTGGVLSGLCTGFVADGICGGSVQNCEWGRQHKNETNDVYLFYTCRPVVLGITPIATNIISGLNLTWWSILDEVWYNGTIIFDFPGTLHNFADGETGYESVFIFNGHQAQSGDSGSPIYTETGELAGVVTAQGGGGTTIGRYLWPSGAQTRSQVAFHPGVAQLFNSDPDR